ncbi:hypothetical protein C8R42DRAFT_643754 [Lentinula raphanica]|nr:hypothetical protein C8R42DRAFT_643754 [Lentinula raphanica]
MPSHAFPYVGCCASIATAQKHLRNRSTQVSPVPSILKETQTSGEQNSSELVSVARPIIERQKRFAEYCAPHQKKAHEFHGYQRTGTESKTHIAVPLYTGKGNRGVEWLSEPQSLIIEWSKAVTIRGYLFKEDAEWNESCQIRRLGGIIDTWNNGIESRLGCVERFDVESITSEFKQASNIAMTDLLNDNSESVTDWSAGWLQSAMMGFGVNSIGVVESRAQLFH